MKDLDTWVELIKRYPDRFMIGSDVVGKVSGISATLRPYDDLLRVLPEAVRRKVAHDTFAKLMESMASKREAAGLGEKGIVLASDYEYSDKSHVQPRFEVPPFMEPRLVRAASSN
jgi:hypothetical protein